MGDGVEPFVRVYSARDAFDAQLIVNLLTEAGLQVRAEETQQAFSGLAALPVAVLVRSDEEAQAREEIEAYGRIHAVGAGPAAGVAPTTEPSLASLPTAAPPAARRPLRVPRSRRELWLETAVVLTLAVAFDLLNACALLVWPAETPLAFAQEHVLLLARSLQIGVPVLYLMYRSGEPWRRFGLRRPRWIVVPLGGAATWVAAFTGWMLFWPVTSVLVPVGVYNWLGTAVESAFARPQTTPEDALLVVSSCANGFAEELVVRGYLIPRFERLLRSTWKSWLLSTALFASYHLYQGPAGVVHAVIVGLCFGGMFCLTRRLWMVVFAHALADIVAFLA
jgi:membrane protease YdiL (CAAX protease family)